MDFFFSFTLYVVTIEPPVVMFVGALDRKKRGGYEGKLLIGQMAAKSSRKLALATDEHPRCDIED